MFQLFGNYSNQACFSRGCFSIQNARAEYRHYGEDNVYLIHIFCGLLLLEFGSNQINYVLCRLLCTHWLMACERNCFEKTK